MGTNMTLDYEVMRRCANKIQSEQPPLSDFVARMQSHIGETEKRMGQSGGAGV